MGQIIATAVVYFVITWLIISSYILIVGYLNETKDLSWGGIIGLLGNVPIGAAFFSMELSGLYGAKKWGLGVGIFTALMILLIHKGRKAMFEQKIRRRREREEEKPLTDD